MNPGTSGSMQPVAPLERIELLDVLRGFALFGVLIANIVWWTQYQAVPDAARESMPTFPLDELVRLLTLFFIDGKFYTLFSVLFGLGFSVMLTRTAGRDGPFLSVFLRRLVVLLAIGVAHCFLLWSGDVLHQYAMLGFVLVLFRHASNRTLLTWGLTFAVAVPAVANIVGGALTTEAGAATAERVRGEHVAAVFAAFSQGGYLDVLRLNARDYMVFLGSGFSIDFLTSIFGKFLLGFYLGRTVLLMTDSDRLALCKRAFPMAVAIGIAGNAVWCVREAAGEYDLVAANSAWVLASHPVVAAGVLAMSTAYATGIAWLLHQPAAASWLKLVAPVGRMALSNYLTHSFVYVFLFYGIGFGLLGRIGSVAVVAIALVVFFAQVLLSRRWLRTFRFGPAEWLWRSLTYGRAQPMR